MKKYIAILKGINVGGHKKILMAELRDLLTKIEEIDKVKTYIQSGNIIFSASVDSETKLAQLIQKKILDHYGFEASTLVISEENFAAIIKNNPYAGVDIKRLHCCFFKTEPILENRQKLETFDASPDVFTTAEDCVYICCATERYSKSNINNSVVEKLLKINCTTRNWKTCNKLLEMAASL